ncbi:hypothetical protein [Dyella choica]|uniref:DUF2384 domain-containing protein n=1 Tax=Dyella choica TaxID=1927959 RepID=A0A3S0S2M8_9GAMM|nr:hypothetical protein [Dyella choica]RUL78993.1 hypothetical protein EKH80_04130 [Dyella choica]
MDAFDAFQKRHPALAQALIEHLGDGRKAARWMCLHQRAFDGKNAYDILIEGHDDLVWDEIARSFGVDIPVATSRRIRHSSFKGRKESGP